jgi:GT2 family glycosyltransferase
LTVVIVNYRTWAYLDVLLHELVVSNSLEVVVVDNRSGDGRLAEYVERYPHVRFVLNSGNHGFAHGCNLGAATAAGETLLFLNPDVRADPERLLRLREIKDRHPEIGILAPRQIDESGRNQKVADVFPGALTNLPMGKNLVRWVRSRSYPAAEGIVQCDWVTGSALMIGRRDFEEIGGFDDHYWMYSEDVDLCHRLRERGLAVAVTGEIVLTHCHAGSSGLDESTRILTKTEVVISKHVFYCRRYEGGKALAAHLTEAVKRCVPAAAAMPLNLLTFGRVRVLRVKQAVLLAVLRHYLRWFRGGSPLSRRSVRWSDADTEV